MARSVRLWLALVAIVCSVTAAISLSDEGERNEPEEFVLTLDHSNYSTTVSNVLTLDHSNFTDTVSKYDFIVVQFGAPGCVHCKNFTPEYEKAASVLSKHDPPLFLAKVDANEKANKGLANEYKVRKYPTLKILRNGGKNVQEYKGPIEADGIVDYLKKQTGPASAEIKTAQDARNLFVGSNIVVIGVFEKFSGKEFENYTAVAERLRSDYDFALILDAELLPIGDSSVTGSFVRLFKPFDEVFVDFKDFAVEALEKFIEDSSIPLVTVANGKPSSIPDVIKFNKSPNAKAMLLANFCSEGVVSLQSKYYEVAKHYKGQGIIFLLGDLQVMENFFQFFGVQESQAPLLLIENCDGKVFLKPNLEADDIATWVKDYKDGKFPPYVKSEPIPEETKKRVKLVFDESLLDTVFKSGENDKKKWCLPQNNGRSKADGIVEFSKRQSGLSSAEIKTAQDARNLFVDTNIVVIGVFENFSSKEFQNYTAVAERLRSDYDFAHTLDAELLPIGDTSLTGSFIRLFKPFDEVFVDFKDFAVDALEKFIEESSIPLVTVLNKNSRTLPYVIKFNKSPNAKAMLLANFCSEGVETLKSKYYEVAKHYKGQGVSFLLGNLQVIENAFEAFGVQDIQAPLILIQNNDGKKFLKENLEAHDIAPWVKDYKDGKVPPYVKSEPIPEENSQPVKVVVADTLQDMVFKPGKNVLLKFYVPSCRRCKKLAPIFDEVAVHYEKDDDVLIVKYDAAANDITDANFHVKRFPTVYFRSANGKITKYKGDRTKEGIIDFIERNRDITAYQDSSNDDRSLEEN